MTYRFKQCVSPFFKYFDKHGPSYMNKVSRNNQLRQGRSKEFCGKWLKVFKNVGHRLADEEHFGVM